jgi:four helix bundle protein
MKGDNIADRLLDFAVKVLDEVGQLPATPTGKHVARQLVRSGTAGGANYEEARAAESRADFAHKVSIAAKEMRESVYWIKLIDRAKISSNPHRSRLIREGNELLLS